MLDDQLRLECLRLAHASAFDKTPAAIVEAAKVFAAFVTGQRDPRLMTASECEGKTAPTLTVSELAALASD